MSREVRGLKLLTESKLKTLRIQICGLYNLKSVINGNIK